MEQPAFAEPLGSGLVELSVHAVGLNFRDVLNVLGEYPGDPGPPGGAVPRGGKVGQDPRVGERGVEARVFC